MLKKEHSLCVCHGASQFSLVLFWGLVILLKDCSCLEGRARALSTFVFPIALAQALLSVFTELTSKFSGRNLFNIFLDSFLKLLQHYEDRMIESVFRDYSILDSPHCPKKEAMASGCKTLSSCSSTATHHSKPFITVSIGYIGLFLFLHFLRVWLSLLLP